MARARVHSGYVSVTTDVDVDVSIEEVLEEISDDCLLKELQERKIKSIKNDTYKEMLEEVVDLMRRREFDHALLLAERALWPKFSSLEECLSRLNETKPAH